MKTIKDIIELYKPKSADEDRFVKKHVIKKTEDANGNKDDVFNATNVKPENRAPNHGYNPGEDEKVYEETEKPNRLAIIAAAAKKKKAQIGKTIVTGSRGGVGGAETRRYPAGTLKNSYEPEGEELDEKRSNLYVGTVERSDPDYEEKVRKLKSKTVGGHRIRGRAPTPEYKHLYRVGGKLHRDSSQDIKPEHSSRVDVYSRNSMKEEIELDEAKRSPIEKLYNRPSMQFAKKYTDQKKVQRHLGIPYPRHLPKDETDTGTTSSLEGSAKRTMQNNSYDSENALVLNPFLRGLLEATCKECGEKYKGKTCPCCMKEDVQIDELFGIGDTVGALGDAGRDKARQGAKFVNKTINAVKTKSATMDQQAAAERKSKEIGRQERNIGVVDTNPPKVASSVVQTTRNAVTPTKRVIVTPDYLRKAVEKELRDKPFQYKEAVPKSYREDVQLDEILEPSMGAAAYIKDFVDSKNPKFDGLSKEKRKQMALAAYYAAKKGK